MTIGELISIHPLASNLVIILLSMLVLVKSADLMVYGIVKYSRRIGISDYVVGFLIIGLATTLPELFPSIMGLYYNDSGIVFGTLVGSGLTTATLILGLIGIIGKDVKMKTEVIKAKRIFIPALLSIPFILTIDGVLSWVDGFILIGIYIIYIASMWKKEEKIKEKVYLHHILKPSLIFLGCFVALLLSSRWIVFSSIQTSHILNIPSFLIAFFVIGLASGLPDLIVQLKSIKHGHSDIGMGNLIGGMIVEMFLILGMLAVFKPIVFSFTEILPLAVTYIFAVSLAIYFTTNERLSWREGIVLIIVYFAFAGYEIGKLLI